MRTYPLFVLSAGLLLFAAAAVASAEIIGVQATGAAWQTSQYGSYVPANGNDRDYATHQDTGTGDGAPYWEVDFGTEISIDGVWTHYRDQGSSASTLRKRAYNLTCTIYNADNTAVYTSAVFNPEQNPLVDPGYGPWKIDLAAPVMGRKVRISKAIGSQTSYTATFHCNEIEVRQDDGLTGRNVAQGAVVTVFGDDYYTSGSYNSAPANLTDGTVGTYCSSDIEVPDPNTFGYLINLGSSQALTHMKVYPRQEAAHVGGGAWAKRLGDYVVSLYDDNGGAPAATANWAATRNGTFSGALGTADVFTASMGAGTFAGQWIKIEATDKLLDDNLYYYSGADRRGFCCLQVAEVMAFVPEPSVVALFLAGALGVLVPRRGREW